MTVRTPSFIQDLCYTAQDDRLTIGGLICQEGVASFDDLYVSENPAGANNQIAISAGHLYVRADTGSGDAGYYHFYNDDEVLLTIPANASPSPVTYAVWARICDFQYTSNPSSATLVLSAADVLTAPADDCTYYKLAEVQATSGFSIIEGEPTEFGDTDVNIEDTRGLYAVCGNGGALRDMIVATASTTFNKSSYPWLKSVRVRVQGGGGSGSGTGTAGTAGNAFAVGSGGGGGGYAEKTFRVDELPSGNITVTVGTGGTAGTAGGGGLQTGGASSFGSPTPVVGNGGAPGEASGPGTFFTRVAAGGAGGTGTGGDLNRPGQTAPAAYIIDAGSGSYRHFGGHGGGSAMAPHRERTNFIDGNGVAGVVYGGGGTGGMSATASTGRTGGAGADGIVIIELYG